MKEKNQLKMDLIGNLFLTSKFKILDSIRKLSKFRKNDDEEEVKPKANRWKWEVLEE